MRSFPQNFCNGCWIRMCRNCAQQSRIQTDVHAQGVWMFGGMFWQDYLLGMCKRHGEESFWRTGKRLAVCSLSWLLGRGFKLSIAAHNLASCLTGVYINKFWSELPNDTVRYQHYMVSGWMNEWTNEWMNECETFVRFYRRNTLCSRWKFLSQCYAVHKFYVYWPGIDPRPPRREFGDRPPESLGGPILISISRPAVYISN
jgi:hypothetical protein